MASALDAGAYILKHRGPMTAMKLQKLVYYSQAWSLVWDEAPLFADEIQAWANGPVAPSLYREHRGKFKVSAGDIRGNAGRLSPDERETVDAVLRHYGGKSSQWLSNLTHAERPWQEARRGIAPGARGRGIISHSAMAEYYGGL